MSTLKEMKWQSLLTAAFFVIMGIILLIYPEATAQTLCYVVGVCGIVIGIFTVLAYLFRDMQKNYYRNDFVVGMMELFLGVFVLYRASLIIELIPFILSILVVVSGISKLQNCIDLRRMNCGNGLAFFILAVINMVLGVLLVINPFGEGNLLFIMLGIGLLFSGLTDTFATLYMTKKIKDYVNTAQALEQEIKEIEDKKEEA